MKVLLVIPPFYQPNSLYPSVSWLNGFLRYHGYASDIEDLSLNVLLTVFSREGLQEIFQEAESNRGYAKDPSLRRIAGLQDQYLDIIETVIRFLQGKDQHLAYRLVHTPMLPVGPLSEQLPEYEEKFGELGVLDRAKYLSSLVIEELSYFIQKTISPHFGLTRYAEHISLSPPVFDPIEQLLTSPPDLIARWIFRLTIEMVHRHQPDVVGFSIPFPGNVPGMFLSAKTIKAHFPDIQIIVGGGYANTELRKVKDPRIFRYIDYLCLDDGELPLISILNSLRRQSDGPYVRTFLKDSRSGEIVYRDDHHEKHIPFHQLPGPDYGSLDLTRYFTVTDSLNPMHRLWSDGFWNKIILAHGCYWHRCTFCDTSLDYIRRYQPARARTIVEWMDNLFRRSGKSGFHFVDEAAPPSLLRDVSLELLRNKHHFSWWGNIRFEKSFTADLTRLMAHAGCIAVTGGLELAHDRLLKLINKGVSVDQVAVVCRNFQLAGIMTHAYLMYGFPTQTEQELIDSLEIVRQFFELGLIQSAYWHRFALTAHAPALSMASELRIKVLSSLDNPFATNDLLYEDPLAHIYDQYAGGLKKALYNFMHQIGIDWDVRKWFDFPVPRTSLSGKFIRNVLKKAPLWQNPSDRSVSVWLYGNPIIHRKRNRMQYEIHVPHGEACWEFPIPVGEWLREMLHRSQPSSSGHPTFLEWKQSFPYGEEKFQEFILSGEWRELRDIGLLFV